MPIAYKSPGVYVEEIPSGVQPIAGVSTSTAGFIGVVPDTIPIPTSPVIQVTETIKKGEGNDASKKTFDLGNFPVNDDSPGTFEVKVGKQVIKDEDVKLHNLANTTITKDLKEATKSQVEFTGNPPTGDFTVTYIVLSTQVTNELIGKGDGTKQVFDLKYYPVNTTGSHTFKVDGTEDKTATLKNDETRGVATVTFTTTANALSGKTITGDYRVLFPSFKPANSGEVKLCTSFNEFKKYFGDFSTDSGQRKLAHAVYGFFNNGGTRCYVMRFSPNSNITLEPFEASEASTKHLPMRLCWGLWDSSKKSVKTSRMD